METSAVLLEKPERLSLEMVGLKDPARMRSLYGFYILEFLLEQRNYYGRVLCRLFRVWDIL